MLIEDPPVLEAEEPTDRIVPPEETAPAVAQGVQTANAPVQDGEEPRWLRRVFLALMIGFVGFFFVHAMAYWVGAHPGVDQNGYLLGGKLFARTLTMKIAPVQPGTRGLFDPHQYVANMWVGTNYGTNEEAYYPKYPLGLPLLIATSLWVGGEQWGPIIAYWINPVAMSLAVLATFLLAREFVGSVYAFLAAAVFATSPVTLGLTTNPNSHATAVCCVTWGMYLLYRWWKVGGPFRASFAGLLIGYAAMIRYTEGALILPVAFAIFASLTAKRRIEARDIERGSSERGDAEKVLAVFSRVPRLVLGLTILITSWFRPRSEPALRPQHRHPVRECGWLLFGWCIPVAGLVAYNLAAMGTVTGYDQTNESTGFSWEFAADNWETALRHLNTNGVVFLLPMALGGLLWMYRRNWRDAVWLTLWVVPCMLTYVAYYWAPDPANLNAPQTISYLRFFLTIVPALALLAFWALRQRVQLVPEHDRAGRGWATVGVGALTAVVLLVQVNNARPIIEQDQLTRLNLKTSADEVLAVTPPGSVIFVDNGPLLNHLQFVCDYTMYSGNNFIRAYVDNQLHLASSGLAAEDPQGWDPGRREALYARLKDKTQPMLDDAERDVIRRALEADLRVFYIAPRGGSEPYVGRQRRRDGGLVMRPNARNRTVPAAMERVLKDHFDSEIVASWNVIVPWSEEQSRTRGQRPRGGVVPPRANQPAAWQIVEITKKAPEPPKPPAAKPKTTAPAKP